MGPHLRDRFAKPACTWIVTVSLCLISPFAFALTDNSSAPQDPAALSPFAPFNSPITQSLMPQGLVQTATATAGIVSLVDYIRNHIDPEPRDQLATHIVRYNRLYAFGRWMHANLPTPTCLDTRNAILVRDSDKSVPLVYRDARDCNVVKGAWDDPYTGTVFKLANAVQIDHVVPLKNAYLSGAYNWRAARRCHYANYLANSFHLRAVSGHENMTKGDRGPDQYIPPSAPFTCQYIKDWMNIKMIWSLSATPDEASAVAQLAQANHCAPSDLTVPAADLQQQVQESENFSDVCVQFEQNESQNHTTLVPPIGPAPDGEPTAPEPNFFESPAAAS